jgi:hypothetical protein
MKAVSSSEMLVSIYQTTQYNITEDSHILDFILFIKLILLSMQHQAEVPRTL